MSAISQTALDTYLLPLKDIFSTEGVNEISINNPGEVWVECKGDTDKHIIKEFTYEHLLSLGRLIAQATDQKIGFETPLLSTTLPSGFRVQVVFPPACEKGRVVMSIRKPSPLKWTLEDYDKMGAFDTTSVGKAVDDKDKILGNLLKEKQIKQFLQQAVLFRKNIIVSGGTSTGKTTFTNAVLRSIPQHERIITVEDSREIDLSNHPNRIHLLASKGGQGRASVSIQDLIEACLRLRPERIIVGELRGEEAFSFLRAINTGHPGSISTLHADTPNGAIEQLVMMVTQAGLGMTTTQIREYILQVVDIIIQLKREIGTSRRYISEIYFSPFEKKDDIQNIEQNKSNITQSKNSLGQNKSNNDNNINATINKVNQTQKQKMEISKKDDNINNKVDKIMSDIFGKTKNNINKTSEVNEIISP